MKISTLVKRLTAINAPLYQPLDTGSALDTAQEQLNGRTFYITTDTLKFFAGRVIDESVLFDGLVYSVLLSQKKDGFNNSTLRYEVVLFDVYGDQLTSSIKYTTMKQAVANQNLTTSDVVEHYQTIIKDKIESTKRDLSDLYKVIK